jgi:hypothetical protein
LIEAPAGGGCDAAKCGAVLLPEPAARAWVGVEEGEDLVARFDENVEIGLADAKDRALFVSSSESEQRRWLAFGRPPTHAQRLRAPARSRDREPRA